MQFSVAYDFGRALSHGFEAFKRAWGPMFLGGFLLTALDNGCQGGGGGGNSGGSDADTEELRRMLEEWSSDASLLGPTLADSLPIPP